MQPLKPKARPCANVVGLRGCKFFEKLQGGEVNIKLVSKN